VWRVDRHFGYGSAKSLTTRHPFALDAFPTLLQTGGLVAVPTRRR